MGVSGAGKTTLLDVLAGRKTGGSIEGEIRIGGYPKVQRTFARISGYCEQSDIHSPQITVEESIIFSAWLRLPSQIDPATKSEFVNEVLETIELDGIKDSIVGVPGVNGLSTEQRKRLTIAVELVSNPSIIFMDEPTSGLDARAAAIVMRAVKNVVGTGRTVVCTIHQPPPDSTDLHFPTPFPQNHWMQFKACLWKLHLSYWRSPQYNLVRMVFIIITSVILAVLFFFCWKFALALRIGIKLAAFGKSQSTFSKPCGQMVIPLRKRGSMPQTYISELSV